METNAPTTPKIAVLLFKEADISTRDVQRDA